MNTNNDKSNEFIKRFNTCAAKWNLIFAYKNAVDLKNWEELETTTFALVRNYADFCRLDVQKMIIGFYPDEDYDWKALEKQMNNLTSYLDMLLKSLDKRTT